MIKNLNFTNFNSYVLDGLILVDFWANWCQPCLIQDSILNEVAKEVQGYARIAKVDISDNKYIADQQKVKNIPTIILYKNGIEKKRFSGIQSKEILIQNLQKHRTL